jgi:Ca2+/H+ antiporter, TMEM165/GDT1 family
VIFDYYYIPSLLFQLPNSTNLPTHTMTHVVRFRLLVLAVVLLLLSVNVGLAAAEADTDLFDRLDSNHDQQISLDEYKSGWTLLQHVLGAVGGGGGDAMGGGAPGAAAAPASWSLLPTYHGGFWKGFTSGVAMILATEIGDKTFFIAAVLSMRQERSAVFCGAILSLYVMTVLSSLMGLVLPALIPVSYTHLFGGVLFLYFGFKLLNDSRGMEANRVSEELEEVEEELLHSKKKQDESSKDDDEDIMESGKGSSSSSAYNTSPALMGFSQVAMQSFTLTFLAEWGDRSQIATIALAAAKNPYGVTVGGCVGHTLCTGLAVLGGRMLAARISEKTVATFGGIIFLIFGVHSVFFES